MADGPNEDDYGLTLDLLRQRLAAAKDPARPVRVVLIGLGPAADVQAMQEIAAAAGGTYLAAPTLDDLEPVLLRALGG